MNEPRLGRRIERRQLLRLVGGGAAVCALSPFVPVLEGDAVAQEASRRRYLFWYTPTMPSDVIVDALYQMNAGPLALRSAWEPLNQVADKLVLIRHLNNLAAKENKMSGGHKSSGITQLSGYPIIDVAGTGFTDLIEGKGLGHSTLDQWMAERITDTPIPSLCFRYAAGGNFYSPNVWRSISSKGGLFVAYHESPRAVYNALFSLTEAAEVPDTNAHERSLLDLTYRSVERIRSRVSARDSQRIEAHLDAIRSMEKRLELEPVSCTLDAGLDVAPQRMDQAQDLYMDLVVSAFSCGLTRVAGGMFHSHINGYDYSFLSESLGNFHQTTHGDGPGSKQDKEDYLRAVLRFRAEQVVKLVGKLDSAQDPLGGTVLDNTILHWTSEVGKNHQWHDLPTFLTSGGYFKTGQMVFAQSKDTGEDAPMNRLHTSIARAMGFDIDHFGDPRYGQGELTSSALL